MRKNSSDDELRSYERRETTDPVASRKARELRLRLGRPRPSDLILEKLPEEARIAFDRCEDWADRIYLPAPSFAPGEPSELEVVLEPEGPDSAPEFYRRFYDEAYEVEGSRFTDKGHRVVGEIHVYSETNGIWESLGSNEQRDVDETTIEDLYKPTERSRRRYETRWLDRRMWMQSWEPYDEHVLDTGLDPVGAYDLDDLENTQDPAIAMERRRRLARCRLRALMWSFTTPEEYFALVGEAGLKWCSERSGQWHHHNPDEDLRRREREGGSPDLRLQVDRSRRGLCGRCGAEIDVSRFDLPTHIEGVKVRRCLVCYEIEKLESLDRASTSFFGILDSGFKELPESFTHKEWGGPRSWKTVTTMFPVGDGLPLVLVYDYNTVEHQLYGRPRTRVTWKGVDRNGALWYGSAPSYGAHTHMKKRKPRPPRRSRSLPGVLHPQPWFERVHSAILRALQEDWVKNGGRSRREGP